MNLPDTVGNWEYNPPKTKITRNTSTPKRDLPKIIHVWKNKSSGDLLVISSWGVGGEYGVWHISEQYIQSANKWLKKTHLSKDTAKYSHGKVVSHAIDKDEIFQTAIEYMENTD
jgi:hypothetical protein